MKVVAPGKLVLTGAYAVLEGAPAIVVAVDRYAVGRGVDARRRARHGRRAARRSTQRAADGAASSASARARRRSSPRSARARLARGDDPRRRRRAQRDLRARARRARARAGRRQRRRRRRERHGGALRYALDATRDARSSAVGARSRAASCSRVFWSGTSARTSDLLARVDALRARGGAVARLHARCAASPKTAARRRCRRRAARSSRRAAAFGRALAALGRRRRRAHRARRLRRARARSPSARAPRSCRPARAAATSPSGSASTPPSDGVRRRAPGALGITPSDARRRPRRRAPRVALVRSQPTSERRPWPRTSRFPGFYKVTVDERRALVGEATGADPRDIERALDGGGLDAETADKFVENVLGTYALPFGVALNVRVNGHDYVVPMVVEEPSVIAAASNAAKMVRDGGGFVAEVDAPLMIAQVAAHATCSRSPRPRPRAILRDHATSSSRWPTPPIPGLVARGGGAREIEVRVARHDDDASWCTSTSTAATRWAPTWSTPSPRRVADRARRARGRAASGLRILSNLCDRRCVRVRCRVPADVARDRRRWTATTSSTASSTRRASPSSIPTAPPRTTRAS